MKYNLLEHSTESELVWSAEGRTKTDDWDLMVYLSSTGLISGAHGDGLATHSSIGASIDGSCTPPLK
jgi:hypothetical protein